MAGYTRETRAGFDCITRKKNENRLAVIVLHGYGADFRDLAPLAAELDPESRLDWYFPNGPQSIDIGGHVQGRAWFDIDLVMLEAAMQRRDRSAFIESVPPGLPQVSKQLQELLSSLQADYSGVILGGFSQGAMVSLDVALHCDQAPLALILLSGSIIAWPRWEAKLQLRPSLSIFQSHGHDDGVLPFQLAAKLHKDLSQSGSQVEFIPFNGGHEIPGRVVNALKLYLGTAHQQ